MIPPFTPNICPVTYELHGDAKNDTAEATSSGVPIRPIGISSHIASFSSDEKRSIISVSITPGQIQLTVIPLNAYSFARAFVRPITPAFEAE